MNVRGGPQPLSQALSELVALKGLARVRGQSQLTADWKDVAGAHIAAHTRVLAVKRGVLEIGVFNSAMLSELASFHKSSLLDALRRRRPELNLRDIKFRLKSESKD